MILKVKNRLTDSNLYICKNRDGEITSIYFLPYPNTHKITDIKFNVKRNKITITGELIGEKNE